MNEEEYSKLTDAEKRRLLFLQQKGMLEKFLERRAISREQFDKSYGDLKQKMGFDDDGNAIK